MQQLVANLELEIIFKTENFEVVMPSIKEIEQNLVRNRRKENK